MAYCMLHKLLEQSKFDEILRLLATSPESQQLIVEEHNSNLPLHVALNVGAPDEVILQMLHFNEDAAFCKGNNSNLPLHIAAKNNSSPEIIERLIRLNPKSLDARNSEGFTPREIGHTDVFAHQSLLRPTSCWLELLDDEEREERQDSRLLVLHNNIDGAFNALSASNTNIDTIISRLQIIDERLNSFGGENINQIEKKLSNLESTIVTKFDKTEGELFMVEDDIKSLETREFMSKNACEATSTEVRKIQKTAEDMADNLLKEINVLKRSLEKE